MASKRIRILNTGDSLSIRNLEIRINGTEIKINIPTDVEWHEVNKVDVLLNGHIENVESIRHLPHDIKFGSPFGDEYIFPVDED